MEEQKRHSGFEAMRILSMVMIVLMHGIGHGGLGSAAPQGSAAFWIYWLLFILARVSTNCFVMLSGYYLSERKGAVRAGRLFRIGAQVWFYSMLTFCVAVRAGAVPLSAVKLLRALLPLTSNGYWFASAYFLMYLSVPVLNAVVQSLDRRQYKTLLLVALLLQSVWGTLFYWATDATFVKNGYSFIWFYILYFMAAYFRKYRVTVPSGLCLLAYLAAAAVQRRRAGYVRPAAGAHPGGQHLTGAAHHGVDSYPVHAGHGQRGLFAVRPGPAQPAHAVPVGVAAQAAPDAGHALRTIVAQQLHKMGKCGILNHQQPTGAAERGNAKPPVDAKRRATRVTAARVTRRGIIENFGGCFSG